MSGVEGLEHHDWYFVLRDNELGHLLGRKLIEGEIVDNTAVGRHYSQKTEGLELADRFEQGEHRTSEDFLPLVSCALPIQPSAHDS